MNNDIRINPIGIFDSGVGGLTVVREIISLLPGENIIYFGDTARVPYGIKSEKTILKFSIEDSEFLISKNVKMIIVACNTASAVSFAKLESMYNIPIINVIEPGAKAAVNNTKNMKIGVIGTNTTVSTKSYDKAIAQLNPDVEIYSKACPLFVPIVEELWLDEKVTREIAEIYLDYFKDKEIDALVLGCTHYPLIKGVIGKVMGKSVNLIDSATEISKTVINTLNQNDLLNDTLQPGSHAFFFSDLSVNIRKIINFIIPSADPDSLFETEVG
jgi:glutamate racemase